ncbi:hypothetical protein DX915_06150, partial [Dialister pneumosintes]
FAAYADTPAVKAATAAIARIFFMFLSPFLQLPHNIKCDRKYKGVSWFPLLYFLFYNHKKWERSL